MTISHSKLFLSPKFENECMLLFRNEKRVSKINGPLVFNSTAVAGSESILQLLHISETAFGQVSQYRIPMTRSSHHSFNQLASKASDACNDTLPSLYLQYQVAAIRVQVARRVGSLCADPQRALSPVTPPETKLGPFYMLQNTPHISPRHRVWKWPVCVFLDYSAVRFLSTLITWHGNNIRNCHSSPMVAHGYNTASSATATGPITGDRRRNRATAFVIYQGKLLCQSCAVSTQRCSNHISILYNEVITIHAGSCKLWQSGQSRLQAALFFACRKPTSVCLKGMNVSRL